MSSPFTLGAPIPAILWSSLEDVLEANMRRLVKNIAGALRQPHEPLLQAIQAHKIKPYIFEGGDDKEVDMRCTFLCQKPAAPLFCQPCGQPVLWSADTSRCAEHAYSKVGRASLPVLRPIEGEEEPLFVSEDDTVYNIYYEALGTYNRGAERLTLFRVLDAE